MTEYQYAMTAIGRIIIVCHCGGGPAHEYRPHGGGARILACPPEPFYIAAPPPEFEEGGER